MIFNILSLFNVTAVLSKYLNYFDILPSSSSHSGSQPLVDDGAETLGTDYLSQQQSAQQFDYSSLANSWCLLWNTIQLWLESFGSPLEFTEFQLHICKTFLVILLANLLLIGFYWRKYGSIITDRFIRPSTAKEIEELKLSVARLKLPKEHSPRI